MIGCIILSQSMQARNSRETERLSFGFPVDSVSPKKVGSRSISEPRMKKEATMEKSDSEKATVGIWAGLIKTQQKNLKSLFSTKKSNSNVDLDILAIPHLSLIANSVVSRCSRFRVLFPSLTQARHFSSSLFDLREINMAGICISRFRVHLGYFVPWEQCLFLSLLIIIRNNYAHFH